MVAFFVAFASCLMLSAAQLLPHPQQMVGLQNLQPMQVPSLPQSQTLMAQAAHSILRQGPGSPIQPGVLGSFPVLVDDTAQSVLDQESKIVGYSMSPELAAVLQQHQQQQQQQQHQAQVLAQGQPQGQLLQHYLPQQIQPQLIQLPHPQQVQIPGRQESQVEHQPQLHQIQLGTESPAFQTQYQNSASAEQQVQNLQPQVLTPQPQQQQENFARPEEQVLYHIQQATEGMENENQQLQANQEERVLSPPTPVQYHNLNQQRQVSSREAIHQNVFIQPQQMQQQVFLQARPIQFHQQVPGKTEDTSSQNNVIQPQLQFQARPIHFHRQVTVSNGDTATQENVITQPEVQLQSIPIQFHQQAPLPMEDRAPQNNVITQSQVQLQTEASQPHLLPTQYQHIPLSPFLQAHQPQQQLVYLTHPPVSNAIEQPARNEEHLPNLQHVQIAQSPEIPPTRLLLSTPKIIPVTQADAVGNRNQVGELGTDRPGQRQTFHQQTRPQSNTRPLITDIREEEPRQSLKVVPLRAKASLKDIIQSERKKQSNDRYPQESIFKSQKSHFNQQKDIPERDSKTEASRTPIRQIAEFSRNNDIVYMRPPPPYEHQRQRQQGRPEPLRAETIYGRPSSSIENEFRGPPPPSPASSSSSPFVFPPRGNDAIEIPGFRPGNLRQEGGPVVHKHIFVHAAPDANNAGNQPRVRVIRPQMNNEKHMNIIFVRSPVPQSETQTVVELPPMEPPKTMVYVLSKKPNENEDNVRVVPSPPMKPKAPEIFFIRYGDNRMTNDFPVPNLQSLLDNSNSKYGPSLPVFQNPGNVSPDLAARFKRSKRYGLGVYAPLMAYTMSGQINEITQEEAESRRTNMEDFF